MAVGEIVGGVQRGVGNPAAHRHPEGDQQAQHHPQKRLGGVLPQGISLMRGVIAVKLIGIEAHRKHSFQRRQIYSILPAFHHFYYTAAL